MMLKQQAHVQVPVAVFVNDEYVCWERAPYAERLEALLESGCDPRDAKALAHRLVGGKRVVVQR
jgi:hypothetical protein